MKRFLYILFVAAVVSLGVQNAFSFELEDTPIQTELKNRILFADEWNIDSKNAVGKEEKSNSVIGSDKKSLGKAILYSALLPGMGEFYVGNKTKAKVFFTAEAMTWIGYAAFHIYGDWKKDDMIRYAADKAGAQLDGKDDQFLDYVGFYDSREDFNSLGRVTDPERPYLYDTPENYWQWTNDADRNSFKEMKNSSREAFRRRDFMIVAAVANRIISVIDAVRDVKKANRRVATNITDKDERTYKFSIDPMSYNRQVSITFYPSF